MLNAQSALRKDRRNATSGMEHRHFATVADIIRNIPDASTRAAMIEHFADALRYTNPKFGRARFVAACND